MITNIEKERYKAIETLKKKLIIYLVEKKLRFGSAINKAECIMEDVAEEEIKFEELRPAHLKMDDSKAEGQDPLIEVNLGTKEEPRPTFVSGLLELKLKAEIIELLVEFKDCFAWSYHEMPGLDRRLVEHRLPILKGFKPYKQSRRRMSTEIQLLVKDEIEKLLKAGQISRLAVQCSSCD